MQVVYQGEITEPFYAKIPRNTNLSTVLEALTLTGRMHCVIDGHTVTVRP